MESEKNTRLGVRSSPEQFKYEQWLANHFPNIDTLENKKRRVQLNDYIFNKLEEMKLAILLIQKQKHKDLEKEQKHLEGKQASINTEKSYYQAIKNYNQKAYPTQKLSGVQMTELYKIQNIYKSYIEFLEKKIADIQSAIDQHQQKLQEIEIAINNSLPILGKLWSDCFKLATSRHKDRVISLRFNDQTINVASGPLAEKIAQLSDKLMSGEIAVHEVKDAQREIIIQYLKEQGGDPFNKASVNEQDEIAAIFETEIWKDAAQHESFGMLKEQMIAVSELSEEREEIAIEIDVAEKEKSGYEESVAGCMAKLHDMTALIRRGEAPASALDLFKEESDRMESAMTEHAPTEEQSEIQRPRMR